MQVSQSLPHALQTNLADNFKLRSRLATWTHPKAHTDIAMLITMHSLAPRSRPVSAASKKITIRCTLGTVGYARPPLAPISIQLTCTVVLIALQAGCVERPIVGTLVGIQGSVFSTTIVTITYPGYNQMTSGVNKKSLSQNGIIGIAVGITVAAIIAIAILFVRYRKRHDMNRMRRLTSPLDTRFGAKNITGSNK